MFSPADWHQRFAIQASWTRDMRRYLIGGMRLPSSARCLEVGCGTGALLQDGSLPTDACLYGADINRDYLRLSRKKNLSTTHIQADGFHLPFACDSFHLVYCHYLLLWLADPLVVLEEMRRVTQPGGWVAAFAEPDYGGRIDSPPPLDELGRLQTLALRAQGADPLMGRRLPEIFHQAGFVEVQSGVIGAQWSGSSIESEATSEEQMLRHDLANLLPADRLAALLQVNREACSNGQRVLYLPTFYAIAQV